MKKIFFMAVSAVLLAAGCQKTEIQNEVLPKIGFDTHVGKLTKADPDAENSGQSANLEAQGFMVWGYFATAGDLNYNLNDLYLGSTKDGKDLGIEVTHAGENTWNTNGVYYWPGKRKELDLYAVSLWNAQTDATNSTVNTYDKVSVNAADKVLTVANFVVNNDADDDLMVAPLIRQDQDDAEVVEPQFQHALAKVLVKFTTTAEGENGGPTGVYVKSVSLKEVINSGTLKVTNDLGDTQETDPKVAKPTWKWDTTGAENTDYTAKFNSGLHTDVKLADIEATDNNKTDSAKETHTNVVPLTKSPITFGSWLLIPQTLTTDTKLVVEYIVDGIFSTTTFDLMSYSTKSWNMGMQITYNVSIAPEYITFTPEVEDWVNDYPEDRGDYDYKSVEVTYLETVDNQTETKSVILYYVDTLVVDSKVFVKENNEYKAAPNNVYTIVKDDKEIQLTVTSGRITKVEEITSESTEK